MPMPEAPELEKLLSSQLGAVFERVTVLSLIDSTNAEAIRRMHALQEPSQLVVGLSQSAGRGRRGRQWQSPAGAGLYLSITQSFSKSLAELQPLSLISALSVVEALATTGVGEARVKWPNDVQVAGKKLAGILLETCQNGDSPIIVFGIGINLDLPDEVIADIERPVTDVRRELDKLGVTFEAADLLLELCQVFTRNLALFMEKGFAAFQQTWNELDAYYEQEVSILNGDQELRGMSKGVDAQGALLVCDTHEVLHRISGGEVFPSLRPVLSGQATEAVDGAAN